MKKLLLLLLLIGCQAKKPIVVKPDYRLPVWRTGNKYTRTWSAIPPGPKPDTMAIGGKVWYKDSGYLMFYSSQGRYILLYNDSTGDYRTYLKFQ